MRMISNPEIHLCDLAKPTNDRTHRGIVLCVAFCLLVYYVTIVFQAMVSFSSPLPLYDYGSLYASVYAWAHHMNPYLVYPLVWHPEVGVRGLFVSAVNLNPPISLYLFRPIIVLGPIASAELWTVVSVCLFCASLVLVIRANPNPGLRTRILLVLGMAGVWYTFELGQIYMILLFLSVVAWLSLKKNDLLSAGVAIGLLCALKPNFLIWPVLLLLARHRKVGISAMLTFASTSIAPLIFGNGLRLYRQWIFACRHFDGTALVSNSAIVAMFGRLDPYLGNTHQFRDLGFAVTGILLLVVAWCAWRWAPEARRTSELALIASLLAGPVTWIGYTVVLIPVLYERQLNSLMRIGWVLLCIPVFVASWMSQLSRAHFVLFASPYFYAITLIGIPFMYETYREHANSAALSKTEFAMSSTNARGALGEL